MTKILSVDEMLAAARESGMPGAADFIRTVETVGTALAHSLASHLGIGTNFADFQEGLGGTCAPFFSIRPEQPCPEVIEFGDRGGDWEDGAHLPTQPDDAPQSLGDALSSIVGSIAAQAATARAAHAQIAAWPVNSNSEPEVMGGALNDIRNLARNYSA